MGTSKSKAFEHAHFCGNPTYYSAKELSGLNIENAEGMVASVFDWIVRERVKHQAAKALAENPNIIKNTNQVSARGLPGLCH